MGQRAFLSVAPVAFSWTMSCVSNPYVVGAFDVDDSTWDGGAIDASDAAPINDAPDGASEATCAPDASCCPASCNGGCEADGTCIVVPDGDGAVPECAASRPCRIDCGPPDSCPHDVSCGRATTCKVQCIGDRSCGSMIACGASSTCTVDCIGSGSCDRIDCAQTGNCTINCVGPTSCRTGIACSAGECTGACIGKGTCAGAVTCAGSCACQWTCTPAATCGPVSCPPDCATADGCTSTAPGCRSCL